MAPEPGWTVEGRVTRVLDGDTLDVVLTKVLRIRLIDCWAPEIHGSEKPEGIKSSDNLKKLLEDKDVIVFIPGELEFKNETTLGRVLGYVWTKGSDKSVNQLQVEQHFAKESK